MNRSPYIYIVAGPNGAGKTTFAREYLPHYAKCEEFINADLIAGGLSPFSPGTAAIEAGRIMLKKITELASHRRDFGFETTLAGRGYIRLFQDLKRNGYRIHLFYLWLPNEKLAIQRVRNRVKIGGHNVPEKDIRRRFFRGLTNLFQYYRPLLDNWVLMDNSSDAPKIISGETGGKLSVTDENLFDKIRQQAEATK